MSNFRRPLLVFIYKTGVPLKTLSEIIDWSKSDILSWYSTGEPIIKLIDVEKIASRFGFSVIDLFQENYNPQVVRKMFLKQRGEISEKYTQFAYSHVRTSAHIVDFLRIYYGAGYADKLLYDMGVDPTYFEDHDNKLNYVFLKDLFIKVKSLSISNNHLSFLGSMSPHFLKDTPISCFFRGARNHGEFYEVLDCIINKFDSNFDYSFQVSKNKIVLEVKPSDLFKEALSKLVGLKDLCFQEVAVYKKHIFESYPIIAGLTGCQADIKKSISCGDSKDQYEIDLNLYKTQNQIVDFSFERYLRLKNHPTPNDKSDPRL